MATQIQKVMYEGYLAADPEMRFLPNGTAVTNFRIGSTRQWKTKDGEKQKETTWIRISAWGAQAEIVNEYASKGDLVIVEGRLNPDKESGGPKVFTRNDGSAGASFEVTAFPNGIRILGKRQTPQVSQQEENDDGDLPY